MKRVLVMLAAMTGLVLAASPLALGADEKAPAPAGEKKAGEKKAGKKAGGKKAEASGAEGKAQAGAAGPLTVQDKVAKMQRLRKLVQAGNMVNLEKVIENCFQLGDPARDRDLLALASFFRAGLFGKSGDAAKCWEWMEMAIGYGFLSASGFEDLSLIPDSFKQTAKFKERMEKLRTDAEILVEEEFRKDVLAGISNPSQAAFKLPEGQGIGIGPNPLDPSKLQGRPVCLIVTPAYHDGFIKEVPGLERLSIAFKDKVEVAALLYQANAANADLREMSSGFLASMKLKSPIPAAVVDRAYVRSLEIPYFPGHFFVTSKGTLAYGRNGFLEEKDLEFIFTEMAKLAPAPEAPKTEPAPAPDPAPVPAPQEVPKADAPPPPPPPAPPAPEKPEEKK